MEVAPSIGWRSAGPWRVGEALGITFTIRAAGMLVGQILGGDLFQVRGYPAPGVTTSALPFVVNVVEHEHARQTEIRTVELLKVPDTIAVSFVGPTLRTHVQVRPSIWTFQVSAWSSPVQLWLFLVSNAVIGHFFTKVRGGEDRSGLHLSTWFDVPAAGPCAVCLLRATADHRFVCLDGFSSDFLSVVSRCLWRRR